MQHDEVIWQVTRPLQESRTSWGQRGAGAQCIVPNRPPAWFLSRAQVVNQNFCSFKSK